MGGFRRFLQIILTLVGLLAVLCAIALFYPIQYLTPFVQDTLLGNTYGQWAMLAGLAFVALVVLVVFLQAVVAPAKRHHLEVKTESGTLSFTKHSVEDTAVRASQRVSGVKFPDAKVHFGKRPEDTKVRVVFQVDEAANVIDLASQVQERVRDTVSASLGIPVEDVNVKVNQLDRSIVDADKQAKQKAVPRVQ
jgi:uncharacterized membrane protein